MKKYSLNGIWKMTGNGYAVDGTIPGSVYSFLYLDNKLLPNPHYRDNEKIYLELANHEYTFERTFTFTPTGAPFSLVFEGLDTLCSVYLNGKKIADTDNMHVAYTFDVTNDLQNGENTLRVVCHPVPPYMQEKNKQTALFGAYDCMEGYPYVRKAHCMMGWDWGPRLPDAGIWRNVYLLERNSASLADVHVTQRHENGKVFLTPNVVTEGEAEIEISLVSPCGDKQTLPANQETEIDNPMLWYPNGLGEQHLYTLTVSLKEQGEVIDEKVLKIGLRVLKLVQNKDEFGESFYHEVNGLSVFAMGADYIPEDNIFSRISPERTRELLTHCKDCHFNAIRVWGGGYYPDDYFFDICDELGLIVFFDLMYACSLYEPDEKMMQSIETEVKQNLKRIRHHACLGLICGNNEIEWHFHEFAAIAGIADVKRLEGIYLHLFEELFPAIIKDVAPYLAYIPSSPTSGGKFLDPNGEAAGDCHDWESDFLLCRNRHYRYVSEFGFQSFPCMKTVESFTLEKDRNVLSKVMERHQRSSIGSELILTYLARHYLYPNDFATFIYASQLLQADSIKYRVEHFRRNRGRCMGTLYWQLNDIWPVTSWASIDYCGRYKALQYAAKRFYAPILLSCEEVGDLQTRRFINTEERTLCKEKSAKLFVTNDSPNAVSGTVKWELRDARSNLLKSGEETLCVPALSVKCLDKIEFDGLDSEQEHLSFSFTVQGKIVSEGSVLFTPPKYYDFENPNLRYVLQGDELIISSDCYAKSVQIEGVDGDLLLEDNFFDMEKGEKRIRILSGKANKILLRSVFDIR